VSGRPLDLPAYLERVRCEPPAERGLEALSRLQQAHLAEIPFENLDILLGRPIRLDLESLQAKLVAARRGGYCFEQNTLFRAALEALGYRVASLAARVRSSSARPAGPVPEIRPRTHMLLLVELPEGRFVTDVGFGGDAPVQPVPLEDGARVELAGFRYGLRREGDEWILHGESGDLYAFTLEPLYPVDFVVANHFTSTWPASPFVNSLTAQRSWPERRAILRNRELLLRSSAGEESQSVRDADHLLAVLEEHFGLVFPSGTRFSRPEF